mgnify:CR=1 FL=1
MVGGISGWQLLILLLIVVLVFGTKRLRNIGSDLGGAVKGFKKGMEDESDENDKPAAKLSADPEPSDTTSERAEEADVRKSGSET